MEARAQIRDPHHHQLQRSSESKVGSALPEQTAAVDAQEVRMVDSKEEGMVSNHYGARQKPHCCRILAYPQHTLQSPAAATTAGSDAASYMACWKHGMCLSSEVMVVRADGTRLSLDRWSLNRGRDRVRDDDGVEGRSRGRRGREPRRQLHDKTNEFQQLAQSFPA